MSEFCKCPNCGQRGRVHFYDGVCAARCRCPACGNEYPPGPTDRGNWNKSFADHGPIVGGQVKKEVA